ncbi:MAG: hypothetical protein IJO63_03335 [Bacilli bacterium]|nr:hypothetical protein [Bacilli bacterium]
MENKKIDEVLDNKTNNFDENENNAAAIYSKSIISFVLFLIVLSRLISIFKSYYNSNDPNYALAIFLSFIVLSIPFFVSVGFSIVSIILVNKMKKKKVEISFFMKILHMLNYLQVPIIILVCVLGFNMKNRQYTNIINQKLEILYGSNYEIINRCNTANEGGDNYDVVLFKLSNYPYLIKGTFNWVNGEYYDNYNKLKAADKLNYQSFLNEYFGGNVVSLMMVNADNKYTQLNLIIPIEYLKSKTQLKDDLVKIINNFRNMPNYENYHFSVDVTFANRVDKALIEEYYQYFVRNSCLTDSFGGDFKAALSKRIFISIDKRDDVWQEVEESINNVTNVF